MAETKFVLKAFFLACVLVIVSQFNYEQRTLESHAHDWLKNSSTVVKLREVAKGTRLVVADMAESSKQFIHKMFAQGDKAKIQRASR